MVSLPARVVPENVFLHRHLLPPKRALCCGQLDILPRQPRGDHLEKVDQPLESFSLAKQSTLAGDPGPNDSTDHNFPCPDQHIQHHPD